MTPPSEEEIEELWAVHEGPQATAERQQRAANLDDTRTWVDPNGYRLSDRLWQGKEAVRTEINEVLRQALASGQDALEVADILEDYLNPQFVPKRDAEFKFLPNQKKSIVTDYPGRGGQGSFPARRLAITEITRAHGQATIWAAERTPFAKGVKWNLNPRHPKRDNCNVHATADKGLGRGVHPVNDVPRYPDHPFDRCYLTTEIEEDDDLIIEELRGLYDLDNPGAKPMVEQVQDLTSDRILHVGKAPDALASLWSPSFSDRMILTPRSREHFLEQRHVDMNERIDEVIETMLDPEEIRRSSRDPNTAFFYRKQDDDRYVVVIIAVSKRPMQFNSLISAHVLNAKKYQKHINKSEFMWKKGEG